MIKPKRHCNIQSNTWFAGKPLNTYEITKEDGKALDIFTEDMEKLGIIIEEIKFQGITKDKLNFTGIIIGGYKEGTGQFFRLLEQVEKSKTMTVFAGIKKKILDLYSEAEGEAV